MGAATGTRREAKGGQGVWRSGTPAEAHRPPWQVSRGAAGKKEPAGTLLPALALAVGQAEPRARGQGNEPCGPEARQDLAGLAGDRPLLCSPPLVCRKALAS